MAVLSFDYLAISIKPSQAFPSGHTVYRPMMVVRIRGAAPTAVPYVAWLDSGSDHCLLPMSLAPTLGFDPLNMPSNFIAGLGKSGSITHYASVEIEVAPGIRFRTMAGFTEGLDSSGIGLLGQSGFFENFRVTFDHSARLFHIDTARDSSSL